MLKSYWKIALRNLIRNKTYSFINIFGLSMGVACCLLLALYIQDEVSYDKHNRDLDRLYRITTQFQSDKGIDLLGSTSPPITMTMWDEIADIESATRLLNPPGVAQNLIKFNDKVFYETDGLLADSSLFDVLTYELTQGNPKEALRQPNSVVISENLSKKLFGNEPALDKMISISQNGPASEYKITGVFKQDFKSHIKANFFISLTSNSGMAEYIRTSPEANGEWAGQNFVPGYVKLNERNDRASVVKQMNEILVKYGSEDMKAMGMTKTLDLEPVKDIYLRSDVNNSPRITYIYVIASIALFILLIACINFMNLATAKANKRAAEIGVRKVMGAFRSSLIGQLLGEAMLIVAASILLSIVLVQVAIPMFNELTNKNISFSSQNIFYFSSALIGITLITGLLAGSYPAFYLSSFQPAQVLKGKVTLSSSSGLMRRSLVVFQFMIAIALVCGMFVISRQLDFMQSKNLGFDSQAKIVIPLRTAQARESYETLKKELANQSSVAAISGVEYIPGATIWSDMSFYAEGENMDKGQIVRRNTVDHNYIEMLGIKMLAGRTFSDNVAMDGARKMIVNRATCSKFGMEPERMVGQNLYFDWQGKTYAFQVIGVMEDYHQNSLKDLIYPICFEMSRGDGGYANLMLTMKSTDIKGSISGLENTWKKLVNDTPFEFTFLDDQLQKQYDDDRRVSKVINSFALIAMIICSLGLYGLSTYMAERRIKEIGVRKVLGASVQQIVLMMNMEFVKLVVIAILISVPLAWYGMNEWLKSFAYRIDIHLDIFLIAGAIALLVALLTVSYESLRAASNNPVDSLRTE